MKSKGYGIQDENDARRKHQAEAIADILGGLADLTGDDLKELGLNIGERRKFLKAVSALGNPDEPPSAPAAVPIGGGCKSE